MGHLGAKTGANKRWKGGVGRIKNGGQLREEGAGLEAFKQCFKEHDRAVTYSVMDG